MGTVDLVTIIGLSFLSINLDDPYILEKHTLNLLLHLLFTVGVPTAIKIIFEPLMLLSSLLNDRYLALVFFSTKSPKPGS